MILSSVTVVAFYVFKSIFEARYWHRVQQSHVKHFSMEHELLTAIRVPFWVLLYLTIDSVWFVIGWCALFPIIHDGVYYTARDIIAPGTYPRRFFDVSKNSTAKTPTLNFWQRLGAGLIGVTFIIKSL